LLNRDHLETFAAVAETRSFERAAGVLSITRGAVSQRIKMLEQALSTVLLVRAQPVVPTHAGEALLRHVKALRMLEGATMCELKSGSRPNEAVAVSIAVNPDSLATWFSKALWPMLLKRQITLEVIVDDEDHTDDRLARGEVLGCVSTEPAAAYGFLADSLGAMEYRCYASPSFAEEFFPDGLSVAAIVASPAIVFDRKDKLHDEYITRCVGFPIEHYPKHRLPAPATLMEAVAAGIGYGLMPTDQAARLVAEGAIIELSPLVPLQVHLYWHHWASEPATAREITEYVVASARELLAQT
jgi:LysR family transcriptional regulator (chromosome initiation inhibitor)